MTDDAGDTRELMARALRELQRAQGRIAELEQRDRQPIAIVGAACRLPGGIDSPAALWQFLQEGGDGTGAIPADRWDVDRFHDPRPGQPGRIVARRGAFLDRVDGFDAAFFGIAPREAELMDPQQRLLLECSWHAFEDAGVAIDALRDTPVGVFVGISTIDYAYHLVQNVPPDAVTGHCGTGTTHAVAAGRIAYCLDLRGPCLALDTACSSSLVGLHLACQSLRAGECDYALVAGVNVMLSPLTGASFSHARMLAPDGRCKTFAAAADGYARGEGAVALLLCRGNDVGRRGLVARAEILGSAVNQDGRSAGLTVPNGPAQAAVIRRALAQAGVAPMAIDVVEAHGTGTALGDPIELQALAAVFAADRPADRPLLVSSIKTNLGHTEAAAGVLSVLKATLQLQHAEVAPHLHFDVPNPHVPWRELPLRVPVQRQAWPATDRRHAGVSSFGFSGTNAHAVLRSAAATATPRTPPPADAVLALALALAARDADTLNELALRYRQRLLTATPQQALDLAFTAAMGRSALPVRCVVLGRTAAELAAGLLGAAPATVVGDECDARLAASARSFVAGERSDLGAHLQALGGRRVAAPLYPFQHRRFWCAAPAPNAAAQLLTLRTVALPPAVALARHHQLAVRGDLLPSLQRALQALGCQPCTDEAQADLWLFAAPRATGAAAALAIVADLLQWLRQAAMAASPPRIAVCVALVDDQAPVAHALRAALRAAAAEMPCLRPRWCALSADADPATVAAALLADDAEDEIEVRGQERWGVRFTAAPAAVVAATIAADRSQLITGGTGALGIVLAGFLIQSGARHLWLASRRGGTVPPDLADLAARAGATVHSVAVDVALATAVAGLVARIDRDGPVLGGVFHLAGVLDDALLPHLDRERTAAQLRPKLEGAWHLHLATRDRALEHFVCFGSAAAWLGNAGQTAYAAANGALDGLCHWRRAQGLPALSMAYGPWSGGGLAAAPGIVARLQAHGVRPLDRTTALGAMAARSGSPEALCAVVQVDWAALRRAVGGTLPARLAPLEERRAAAPDPPRRRTAVTASALPTAVAAVVAAVLGQPAGAVAADAPLAGLGLDSLLAVDLQQRLHSEFGLDVPLSAILGATDSRALAASMRELGAPAGVAPAAAGEDRTGADGADLIALVEKLSDVEVRALLARDRSPGDAAGS